jgi:hypothetical protein
LADFTPRRQADIDQASAADISALGDSDLATNQTRGFGGLSARLSRTSRSTHGETSRYQLFRLP